jgi:hypothetical protein
MVKQMLAKVGADEPRPTSDQDPLHDKVMQEVV